jgi:uncharacterized protein DUF4440
MRNFAWLIIAISLFVLGWNHTGLTAVSAATDETQAVIQASRERLEARDSSNVAVWERDTSQAVRIVDDDGSVNDRTAEAPSAHPLHPDNQTWETVSAQFVDGVAFVSGTMREVERFPGGTIISHRTRTEVWAKENGRWVAIHVQVTPLPENHIRATAPPENLAQYVGTYEWAPDMIENISERGHALYSALGGPPDLLYFVGLDETALSDDLGVGTFYRDPSGKVVGYTYKQCDGQTIKIRKIR